MVARPPPDRQAQSDEDLERALAALREARAALQAHRSRLGAEPRAGGTSLSRAILDVLTEDGGWWTTLELIDHLRRDGRVEVQLDTASVGSALSSLLARGCVEREPEPEPEVLGARWRWRARP